MKARSTRSRLTLQMTKLRSNRAGFTLLELLAVMGIMLILGTIAVTSYRSMVSGSGITASLGHLRQSLALARQQAIMQGKSAYVVFYQDTNQSWYVSCMAEGSNEGGYPDRVIDYYRSDKGQVELNTLLYNLSKDYASFAKVTSFSYLSDDLAYQFVTAGSSIWTPGYYGWEVSQRVQLPRGFKFSGNLYTIRFKPDGTLADASGNAVGTGREIGIFEEIRSNAVYKVKVNFNGTTEVDYPY